MKSNYYGNILSYRPDIRYKLKETNVSIEKSIDTYDVLSDFVDNTPSPNLYRIDDILSKSESIMKELQDIYLDNKYSGYTFVQYAYMVNDKKDPSYLDIYEEAVNDIESNIVIEMYKKIDDEYNDVLEFSKMYKKTNYGNDDISTNDAEDIDFNNVSKISEYSTEYFEKINCAALDFETKLNKIVELKLEISSTYLNTLSSIPLSNNEYEIEYEKEDVKSGIKILFDSINEEYKYKLQKYEEINSFDSFGKLYSYISNKLIEYYELLSINKSLFSNAGNFICNDIEKLISEKSDEINFYITELYKLVAKNSIYLDDFSNILNKKDEVKRYYMS